MAGSFHHPVTPQPEPVPYVIGALVGHVVLLVLISLAITQSIRTAPAQVIQVRIVGVPVPAAPKVKPQPPEPVRTQDSAAPKEPPPDAKNIPPSEAKSKFVTDPKQQPVQDKTPTPIEAKERPPTLDKNPLKKKVVKNDLNAKVVKNPEDFLNNVDDFLKDLKTKDLTPSPTVAAKPTEEPAGEGPQIQLNLSEQGQADGIRDHIQKFWIFPSGIDTSKMRVRVYIYTSSDGHLTKMPQVYDSSGNAAFDRSLITAIRKAEPLPVPEGNDKFRTIDIGFDGIGGR